MQTASEPTMGASPDATSPSPSTSQVAGAVVEVDVSSLLAEIPEPGEPMVGAVTAMLAPHDDTADHRPAVVRSAHLPSPIDERRTAGARPAAPRSSAAIDRAAPLTVPLVEVPSRRQRRAARRLQARKVGRLIRHVDLWSVLKLSLVFYLTVFLVTMFAGVLLWAIAVNLGVVGDIEGFVREAFALKSFAFDGGRIFRAAVLGGFALVLASTTFSVLLAALFNLMSDLVGGIRVTVVEEETARPVSEATSEPAA